MKALITGASSGIGKEISKYLSKLGYELILVSSNEEKLTEVSKIVPNSKPLVIDLKNEIDLRKLLEIILEEKPQIVINNAGFGLFGTFDNIDKQREYDMIKVNVLALQKITDTCLTYMKEQENTYILNVSSIAGLLPGGPLLNTYYATKNYVRSYTLGIYEELKAQNLKTNISVLCPGPVDTNFNKTAVGHFSLKSLTSEYVVKYGIDKMFKKKLIIIPGIMNRLGYFFQRFIPTKILLKMILTSQHKKTK